MNIQIYKNNFDLTDSFEQYLRDKFSALDRFQSDVTDFKVDLSRDQHHNKGEVFTVEVHITMPQQRNIMAKESHEDARAAVDLVQDSLARQLKKMKEKDISLMRKGGRLFKSIKFWNKNE
jgi:ribosomal subunit interface protein